MAAWSRCRIRQEGTGRHEIRNPSWCGQWHSAIPEAESRLRSGSVFPVAHGKHRSRERQIVRRLACARVLDETDRANELVRQAASFRRRGQTRKALLSLRQACYLDESRAVNWMIYGDLARRAGRRDEAERAMKQALWLRQRAGDAPRANVIRRLLLQLASV